MHEEVLVIAGSDPSGGAGLQADLEAMWAFDVNPRHLIAAVTVQDERSCKAYYSIPTEVFVEGLELLFSRFSPQLIKIGMLANEEIVDCILTCIQTHPSVKIILDPVASSSSGVPLISEDGWDLMKKDLFPLCFLVTPNIPEAELLTGLDVTTASQMEQALLMIKEMGPENILLKAGHFPGDPTDLFFDGENIVPFYNTRIKNSTKRGTGCRYASAITALLAKGESLSDAIMKANNYVHSYIISGK